MLVTGCLAQGPKILIVTDVEGVGGINDANEQLLPGQRRFMDSQRLVTGEVNAAVEGALYRPEPAKASSGMGMTEAVHFRSTRSITRRN